MSMLDDAFPPESLNPDAAYKDVLKCTEDLRSAVQMALDDNESECDAIASMDADKILRRVAIRTARHDTLTQLEKVVLQRMDVWCKTIGLTGLDLVAARKAAPEETERLTNALDSLQERVTRLKKNDQTQAQLLNRMRVFVDDYVQSVILRSTSYNRRGKTPVMQAGSTLSYRV